MKIRNRLIGWTLSLVILVAVLGFLARVSHKNSLANFQEVCGELLPQTVTTVKIEKELYHLLYAATRYANSGNPEYKQHVEEGLIALAKAEATYRLYRGAHSEQENNKLSEYVRKFSRQLSSYLLLNEQSGGAAAIAEKKADIEQTLHSLESMIHSEADIQYATEVINGTLQDMHGLEGRLQVQLVVIVLLALLSALVISRRIVIPLARLHAGVQRISNGDLLAKVPVSSSRDELSALAESFNVMSEALQQGNRRLALEISDKEVAWLQAQEASRVKSEFLNNMGHELRTPMNAIIGFSNFLQTMDQDEITQEYLQEIHEASNALLAIINQVLEFSDLDSTEASLPNTQIEISHLLDGLAWQYRSQAERKGLEFRMVCAPDIPSHLVGPEGRLLQLLGILFDNAVKFTSQGHVVLTVALISQEEDQVTLSFAVQDTGIGIAAEDMDLIFSAFSQKDGSHTREFGGIGLGLALAKGIVEKLGGTLSVTSELGQGSTFSCELPFELVKETV